MTTKKTLFYDLDNTLALFSIKGQEGEALERMFEEGFFRNLPILNNAMEALAGLMWEGHDVHILSACINSPFCKAEKLEWIAQFLPFIEPHNIHLCDVGQNKAEMIGDVVGTILVDDYHKNLEQWTEAGGIAVKKRFSEKKGYERVVRDHMEIFDIIEQL